MHKKGFWLSVLWAAISLVLLILLGCDNTPTDPSQNPPTALVQQATATSAGIYGTVADVEHLGSMMRGAAAALDFGAADVASPQAALQQATQKQQMLQAKATAARPGDASYAAATGDSLLWEVTQVRPFAGYTERVRYYYDSSTGFARIEAIKFDFDDRHQLAYDSVQVQVDVNFTIDNNLDDVLLAIDELKRFKPGRFIRETVSRVVPDPYLAGGEPDGGTFFSQVSYSETSFIRQTTIQAELHAGSGGRWGRDVIYADNTTSQKLITFNEDGTGTFEETGRFGVRVTGTFDDATSDGTGSFTKTTTFPTGSNPITIDEAGTFSFNAADSSLQGSYSKEVRFRDGSILRESVQVQESIVAGVKNTTVQVSKNDGSGGTIRISESSSGKRVEAEWNESDGRYTLASADYFPDGSARLEFATYASRQAYDNGDDPIASGVFNFNPDGTGQGQVTEDGTAHDVTVGAQS